MIPICDRPHRASVARDPLLAPLLGAIHFCSATGGLHCVATSGYSLATLRVAVTASPATLRGRDTAEGALGQAIRCPECQSLRVDYPQYARHSLLTNLALGFLGQLGLVEKDYYCENCHFTWPKDGTRPRSDRAHQAPFYFIEGVEKTTQADRRAHQTSEPEEQLKAA